jgi:copper chaperone CopZ
MRPWFVAIVALVTAAGFAGAGKVEVKNVHLCCGMCVKGVGGALKSVDGVESPKCDQKAKTVTFTTKDAKTTAAALKALTDAGYFGAATDDGKEVKLDAGKAEGKADAVTVKGVHVCCPMCQKAIDGLFKDAKVSYTGKEASKEVKISGKGLEKAKVLETLQKAGFTGKVE